MHHTVDSLENFIGISCNLSSLVLHTQRMSYDLGPLVDDPQQSPSSLVRRGLGLVFIEGAVVSGMFACTELWLVPLLQLRLGGSETVIGLLAIVPQIALIMLGLAVRPVIEALGGNRRTAVATSLVQIACLLLLALPLHLPHAPWAVPMAVMLTMLIGVVGGIGGPAWVAWMGDLIPRTIRGRFTGNRNRIFNLTRLGYVGLFAVVMMRLPAEAGPWGLQAVLLIAAAARSVSVWLQWRTPEPSPRLVMAQTPSQRLQRADVGFGDFLRGIHRTTLGRWTLVWASLFSSVMVSGPFFVPYMLASEAAGGLALSPLWYSVLTNVNPVVKMLTYPVAGRLIEIHGATACLRVATVALVLVPLGWAFSFDLRVIIAFEVLSGMAWAMLEISIGVLLFSCHPDPLTRARLIGYHQAVCGAFTMLGAGLGTLLISWDGLPLLNGSRFHTIFLISMVLRLPALVMALMFLPTLKATTDDEGELWRLIPGSGLVVSAGRGLMGFFSRPSG